MAEVSEFKLPDGTVVQLKDEKARGAFPIGSIYVTSTNENPASYLDGTWELVDKHLKRGYYSSSDTTGLFTPSSNVSDGTVVVITAEHHVTINVNVTNATALGETDRTLGVIDFTKCGFNRLSHTIYNSGFSEPGNAMTMMGLIYGTGELNCVDVIPKVDSGTIAAGNNIRVQFNCILNMSYFDDNYCDKFFWKRTA
jgi:hypothetical protein